MSSAEETMQRVNSVLATVVHGIVTFDGRGSITSFNHAAERIFGYAASEVVGRNVTTLLPDPYRSRYLRDFTEYLRSGQSRVVGANLEVEGRRKNGSVFPVDLSVSEAEVDDTRMFVGVLRDITKRKQAEEALRRSEERFDLAVRGSKDGLWDWDIRTDKVYYAPQYMALLGFEADEYPGIADSFRTHLHPEDRDRVFDAFMAHLKEHKPFDEEFRHRCKDGSIRHFRARGQAIWDETGKATRMAGSITDITERKEFERKLAEARDAAETANNAKSRFVANMSHELRTPLNSVIGFSNLLLKNNQGNLNKEDLSYLQRIRDNGIHLLSLINEVLDLSKVEVGRTELEIGPVRLDRLVREVITSIEGAALEKHIALSVDVPDGVDVIQADEKRLKQVLINLAGNAVKFTERGEVTIRLRTAEGTRRPVEIEVSDTGIGIPPDEIAGIFEAFHQADGSTARKYGGTGLGLAISRSLCRLMGFDLVAASEVGRGSTFRVVLDARPGTARRMEDEANGARARR